MNAERPRTTIYLMDKNYPLLAATTDCGQLPSTPCHRGMKIMVRQPGATIGYIIDADDQRPEFEQAKKAFLLRLHGERVDLEVKLLAVQRLIAKVENMEKPE